MNPMDIVKSFVSGEMKPREFEQVLYRDKDLENLLLRNPPLPPYVKEDGLYLYLISKDYDSLEDMSNARDALCRFLRNHGIDATPSDDIRKRIDEKYKILPKWLQISDEMYDEIRKSADGLTGSDFISFMKDEIKRRFVSLNKPPKWLQDVCWPILDGKPLIFVGQLDISKIRHDTSYVYVFGDGHGRYTTIEQSM